MPKTPAAFRLLLPLLCALTLAVGAERRRNDGAAKLPVKLGGSLQNPAFSPDGRTILFTRFRKGYNRGAADLYLFEIESGRLSRLIADGSVNVNLPGTSWNPKTDRIVFSSSRGEHDEIYLIRPDRKRKSLRQVTRRRNRMAYEPSFGPKGRRIVFESHPLETEGRGRIVKRRIDTKGAPYRPLTPKGADCRQPNWSPTGEWILYQRRLRGRWDLWITDPAGREHRQVTAGKGDKTDAVFTPDGERILFSAEGRDGYANIYRISLDGTDRQRITRHRGYDGAPSLSPDGTLLVFESAPGDPDGSAGTTLWIKEMPE